MNQVTGISEPLLTSFFVSRLKLNLKREVMMAKPKSLMEAFSLALDNEARFEELVKKSQAMTRWPTCSGTLGAMA